MALFLAYSAVTPGAAAEGPWDELFFLTDELVLVRSDLSRSAVYHGLKDALPARAALLVTELHEVPKFKGMTPGALAWARRHLP